MKSKIIPRCQSFVLDVKIYILSDTSSSVSLTMTKQRATNKSQIQMFFCPH